MKPFNLEEALAGKPLITRDCRRVSDFKLNYGAEEGMKYIYSVYFEDQDFRQTYSAGGEYVIGRKNQQDLFMEDENDQRSESIRDNPSTETTPDCA